MRAQKASRYQNINSCHYLKVRLACSQSTFCHSAPQTWRFHGRDYLCVCRSFTSPLPSPTCCSSSWRSAGWHYRELGRDWRITSPPTSAGSPIQMWELSAKQKWLWCKHGPCLFHNTALSVGRQSPVSLPSFSSLLFASGFRSQDTGLTRKAKLGSCFSDKFVKWGSPPRLPSVQSWPIEGQIRSSLTGNSHTLCQYVTTGAHTRF